MFENIGISIQWNYTRLKVKFNIFNRAVGGRAPTRFEFRRKGWCYEYI